jgi:hypothetical protein
MKQQLLWSALAVVLASWSGSASAGRLPPGEEALSEIGTYLKHGDCSGAIKRLNEGLSQSLPEVFLVAGSMYDEGICVKPDWKKAVHFYGRAYEAGQRTAASRLAAGFASPEHGPDIGAALWWANRPGDFVAPGGCQLPEALLGDPDGFVAELQRWPAKRLAACNYAVGLAATVTGEMHYPGRALAYGVEGSYVAVFTPAAGRVEAQQLETYAPQEGGGVDGNFAKDRESKKVTGSFDAMLQSVAARALKRYPKPDGIDPGWQFKIGFKFSFTPL